MLERLVQFWRGLVRVRIESGHTEQILNALHREGVGFWKLTRIDAQSIAFTIREKDLKRLEKMCARYFAEVHRISRFSKNALIDRYKKRWGLLLSAALFCGGFLALNCFVWEIEVIGCEQKLSQAEVTRMFDEMGLHVGSLRFGIDADALENEFLLQNDDAIWVSVNLRFTTAQIEVRERPNTPQVYDYGKPCDIYAARDGQIVEMMVTSGTALVKEGDAVYAGEMLISRKHVSKYGEERDVHALGAVKARTTREITVSYPLTYREHVPTGESKKFIRLNVFNFKIPLYFNREMSYNNYDRTESVKNLKIGRFLALPFGWETETFTEVTVTERRLDEKTAKTQATAQLSGEEKRQLAAAEILEKKIEETADNDTLTLTATYTCLEDIALALGEE